MRMRSRSVAMANPLHDSNNPDPDIPAKILAQYEE